MINRILLVQTKEILPTGIFVNEEFLFQVEKNRDTLRPILKLAISLQDICDKSKLENDKLIINGIAYTVQDLHQLPSELVPYKATQKTNNIIIGF